MAPLSLEGRVGRNPAIIGTTTRPPPSRRAIDPGVPFVGRQPELAYLRDQLDRAVAGEPRLVLIEGAAGIGKTALAGQFLAAAGDACVLWASGDEAETALAFGVLGQLLAHTPVSLPDPLAGLSRADQPQVDPMVAGAALVDLLGELQHAGLVVVVVDDAHWADSPSLHALTFALRRLGVDRVLTLVLTREAADPRLPAGLCRLLASDHTLRLSLGGLDADELRALSRQLGASLTPRAAARLRAHTGGNPLHARALLEQVPAGVLGDPDVPLPAPHSFAMLVLARLAACPADVQALVLAASVLGTRFPLHQAATVAQLADPLHALEEAITAGLLVERPGTRIGGFPHPLVQAAIYQHLGPARRAILHMRAADLVEEEPARLRHRARAASGPDRELAADLAALGRAQASAGMWASAADHLTLAARLADRRTEREQLTLEAVEGMLLAGDLPDPAGLTASLRTFADTGWRSYVLGRLAFVAGHAEEAGALLRRAWEGQDSQGNSTLAARVASQLAALCIRHARGHDAADWADRALQLAPGLPASDLIHYVRLSALGVSGQADAALQSVATLPDPAVASVAELGMLLGRGVLRVWTDDLAGAREDLAGVLKASRDRSAAFRLLAAADLGVAEQRAGFWDDAIVHFDLARSIAADADLAYLAPYCHQRACQVFAARGQWEMAEFHARSAQAPVLSGVLGTSILTALSQAHLARARGQPAAVVAALTPLLRLDHCDGIGEPAIACWHDLLAEALVSEGRCDQAGALLASFEKKAAARGRHSAMAAAARARGNLEAARGNHAAADDAFQAGLLHAAEVEARFDRSLLQLAYGQFLRRAGRKTAAASQLQAARATLIRLGARPDLERCERELAACGLTPARRREPDAARLTPQELAVARLAAKSLTNRQIARELVVSVKTVEYHLGHVYAKLQVTSRVQLALQFTED